MHALHVVSLVLHSDVSVVVIQMFQCVKIGNTASESLRHESLFVLLNLCQQKLTKPSESKL